MGITATREDGIITLTLADGTTTTRRGKLASEYTHVIVRTYERTVPNINFAKSRSVLVKYLDDDRATTIEMVAIVDA